MDSQLVGVSVLGIESVAVTAEEAEAVVLAEMQIDCERLCVTERVIDGEPVEDCDVNDDAVPVTDDDGDVIIELVNVGEIEIVGDLDCDVVTENVALAD